MTEIPSDIAFTPTVKAIQEQKGSRAQYAEMEEFSGWQTTVTPELAKFIGGLDMFYLGTANAAGQPYIQYRGGAPGFLKVLDEHTLGFADFGGNQQYITLGNLAENPKAFIFLMDYANSRRVKLWGTAKVIENDAKLIDQLRDPNYRKRAGTCHSIHPEGVGHELPAAYPQASSGEASCADYREIGSACA